MTIAANNQGIESRFTPNNGAEVSVSLGGVAVVRDAYQGRQSGVFQLVYRAVSESAMEGFLTEYDSQSRDTFTITDQTDSTVHTVVYTGQPQVTYRQDANAWDVVCTVAKVPGFGSVALESGDVLLLENDDEMLTETP